MMELVEAVQAISPLACDVCSDALNEGQRWITRDHCGLWKDWELVIYQWSNLTITAAYLAIATILGITALPGQEPALRDLSETERTISRTTYAAFILFCGVGHLEGVLSFIWPRYDLFLVWHVLTALVSMAAVGVTVRMRHRLLVGV